MSLFDRMSKRRQNLDAAIDKQTGRKPKPAPAKKPAAPAQKPKPKKPR